MLRAHNINQHTQLRIWIACATLLLTGALVPRAVADEPTTTLKFEVVGGENEKPIENASIYVKFKEERTLRRDRRVEWHAKTNREGVTLVREVRRGKVLIQVVASGWKTYGKFYDINEDEQRIRIKLDRPPRWY